MRIHAVMCFVIVLALMTVGTASALSPPIVYVSANNDGDYNCDGTDDDIQINQALRYVENNGEYTTVYLKNDGSGAYDYIISDKVYISSHTHLTGDTGVVIGLVDEFNPPGDTAEEEAWQFFTGDEDVVITSGGNHYHDADDVEISNITFDFDRFGQSYIVNKAAIRDDMPTIELRGSDIHVHDCVFKNAVGDHIRVANYGTDENINIHDNLFEISGHCDVYVTGTRGTESDPLWIHNNTFDYIYANAGIRLDEVSGALIENNTFFSDTQWSDHGVYISYVNDDGAGTECKDNEVRYNEFHNVREWAILFCARVSSGGTKSETTGNYIHHNMIYEGLGYDGNAGGINVYGMDQAVVEYNTIVDGEGDGIACEEYLNYGLSPTGYTITVENNIIQGMSTYDSHQYGIANHETSSHTINSNYNNIYDCDGGNYLDVTEGGYDTHVDSKFYDATNDIYTLKSTAGVWDGDSWETSAEQSLCIDGADPSDPYSNEPENNGDRANMGRWGNTIYASKSGAAEINVNSADSIQDAVDAATNGDTIIVYPGVYTENVDVYKKLTIISESGNPIDTIVQAASSNDHVFHVTADNVTINGFTATGVTGDDKSGIYLYGVEGCTITNNIASNNDLGIYLYDSSNNTLSNNTASSNNDSGISLYSSSSNLIYNNYFNNTNNTLINDSTGNVWNITKTAGTNIIGGSYLGGNYWAHPNGTGFSQTNNTDADRDGICDETYTIASDHIDYLPLAAPLVYPVANFTANVTEGLAPLSVAFTDLSTDATSWSWDIDDDGTVDNSSQNFIHTYDTVGLYTVNLTVSNGNGTDTQIKMNYITVIEPVLPVADFTGNVTKGIAPLTVAFTDFSTNATSWAWDVNDNGTVDYTTQYPVHTYTIPGLYTVNLTVSNGNGTDTQIKMNYITVIEPVLPVADFTGNVTKGIAPLTVAFTDFSTNATSWAWDVNDNGTVDYTTQYPVHTYTIPGLYTVNLTVSNGNGTDTQIKTNYITVIEPVLPVADFTGNVTKGIAPLTVAFTDFSTNATSWAWDVNDNGTVDYTTQYPVHTYTIPGLYTVNLTVSNGNDTDTQIKTNYITVIEPGMPVANFTANVTEGDVPLTVAFTDLSTDATSWSWDIDDDGTEDYSSQNFIHTYDTVGLYTVNLTVSNINGTASEVKTSYINVTAVPILPVANFTANVTEGDVPLIVAFTDLSTNATSWSWDIDDDGTVDNSSQNFIHTYDTVGLYTVNLTVSNLNGTASEVKSSYINVTSVPILPVANFTANVTEGDVPLIVAFIDLSTNASTWSWDIDNDGTEDYSTQHIVHTYDTVGLYTVNLTVSNLNGTASEVKTGYINVTSVPILPVADFSANVTEGPVPLIVAFIDLSTNASTWSWDIDNDGTEDYSSQHIVHTYDTVGLYTVNLTVSNLNGTASEVKTGYINVTSVPILPVADFSANVTEGPVPLIVSFIDLSSSASTWSWDIDNDGTEDYSTQHIVHTYDTVGLYTVNLTVSNLNGTASEVKSSYINVTSVPILPVANFTANVTEGDVPLIVAFIDLSTNASTWSWDIDNDGTEDYSSQHIVHTYDTVGLYTVNLTVSNLNGTASEVKTGYINVTSVPILPVADFSANVTEGPVPLIVSFTDLSTNASTWSWDIDDDGTEDYSTQHIVHTYDTVGLYTVNLTVSNLNGTASEVKSSYINVTSVPILPVADFSANATEGYVPLTVSFTDLSTNASTWSWDIDDDGTEDYSTQHIVHTYDTVGLYTVNLTVSNLNGTASEVKTGYINVTAVPIPPVADFSANATEGYVPLTVSFTDLSTNASTWSWDIDDDGTEDYSTQHIVHTYDTVGLYTVNLTVSNLNGTASEVKTSYINVTSVPILPVADFSANVTEGYVPLTVSFTDLSTNASTWSWDIDDDGTEDYSTQHIVHTYDTVGLYTVNLTVSNLNGTASEVKSSYINVTSVPILPVADFSANVTEGYVPLTVSFTDLSTNASTWSWDIDDDGTEDYSSQHIVHTYDAVGLYTVNLTVSNLNGTASEVKSSYINVTSVPILPVADFSANVTEGYVPLTVAFTDLSTNASTWSWDIDDDGTEDYSTQHIVHTYDTVGLYTVNLTVSNLNGTASEVKSSYINVTSVPILPVADFSANVTEGYVPLTVSFTDLSTNASTWSWDIDDDGTEDYSTQHIVHTYDTVGLYTVNLTVSNLNGTASEVKTSYINVTSVPILPVADFSANATEGYVPLTVAFTDLSTNASTWSWDIDDDGTEDYSTQHIVHTYDTVGLYTVNLTVSNLNGTASEVKTSYINVTSVPILPVADFSANVTEGYVPLTVSFTDLSTNASTWSWDIDDDGTEDYSTQHIVHTYDTVGLYTVNLTVSNLNGTASEVKTSYINVTSVPILPVADFSANVTEGYVPLTVAFTDLSTNASTWSWDIDDDGTEDYSTQHIVHTYDTVGLYTVNLTVSNLNGTASEVKSSYINVTSVPILPVADFSANVTEGYVPLTVSFTDLSTNASTWSWDIDDDGTEDYSTQHIVHTYDTVGLYTVNLTVSNLNGTASEVKTSYINVTSVPILPVADFSANVTEGYVPLTVSFTDLSTNASTWSWDIDDDGTEDYSTQHIVHTYDTVGLYTVNLTVSNLNGTASEVKTSYINVTSVPILPVADFSANVTEGYVPLTVSFTDLSTNASTWSWDIDDDGTEDYSTQHIVHTYDTVGLYTVNLTVSNLNGTASEVKTSYINVTSVPILPVADFSANATEGYVPLTVAFTDLSTNASTWSWDIDDDGTEDYSTQNIVHTYDTVGLYTVNLTVSNLNGTASEVKTSYINVTSVPILPVADFSANVTEGYVPLTVAFTDLSTNASTWSWDIDDDGTEDYSTQHIVHTYDTVGLYTVNLTVSNLNGTASEVKSSYINVTSVPILPVADFSANVTEGDVPLTVAFTDLSTNASTWSWDIDDDGTEDYSTQHIVHTYDTVGLYTVNLTVSNLNGTASEVKSSYINVTSVPILPVADFSANATEGYVPLTVAFTDLSTNASTWSWDIDDDGTEDYSTQNIVHTYDTVGLYTVNLTVENDDGDSDTEFQYVVVYDPSSGSVTGRGTFDSPASAYVDEPGLTGVATFVFNSKYKKGVLTGEMQFEFENLNFQSVDYEWMLVAGHKAIYKGYGTVNGEGNYEFLVSVIDAELTPDTGTDIFRIKIWNATDVIYDNNVGVGVDSGDFADPITPLVKGRIQIKS